jgi:hypothetical protein
MADKVKKRERDWSALDAAHRKRGELITIFYSTDGGLFEPPPKTGRVGGPRVYSDNTIEAVLTIKHVTRLSLRAIEGFVIGMREVTGGTWPVPNYTTLSRREATLKVDLCTRVKPGEKQVLIVDSTGLKVMGEGEWKVRKHGTDGKRRTWIKAHILVDRATGDVLDVSVTSGDAADCPELPKLLPAQLHGAAVLGDGAYHTKDLHREIYARGGVLLTPPPKNARKWKPHNWAVDEPAFRFRNSQLTPLQRLGRTQWKVQSGLGQRSFIECTNNRLKSITGSHLSARKPANQVVEVRIRCKVLNRLAVPGRALAM